MTEASTDAGAVASTQETTAPENQATVAGGQEQTPTADALPQADWRKEIAGGDEKLMKNLERFGSIKDLHKSYQEATQRIREGFKPPELPENPTEEQVAEYRKLIGVPNEVTEYKINLPEGIVLGEADKPLWDLFLSEANKMNLTQAELDKVAPAYYAMEAALKEQQEIDVKEASRKNEAELREVWGSDYLTNMNVNENFLVKEGGDKLKETLMFGMAPDGSPLANHPVVAKFLNDMARIQGFADTMAYGDAGPSGLQDELNALQKMMGDHKSDYWKGSNATKHQERYRELLSIQDKLKK